MGILDYSLMPQIGGLLAGLPNLVGQGLREPPQDTPANRVAGSFGDFMSGSNNDIMLRLLMGQGGGMPQAPQGTGAQSFDESGFSFAPPTLANVPMPPRRPSIQQDAPMNIAPQASNAMAQVQPQPQQRPMAAPQAEPGFMDRLSAASRNLGANPGLPGIFDAIKGFNTGERTDPQGVGQANQAKMAEAIYGALRQRSIPDQQAMAIARAASIDPKLAETLLPQALGLKPPSTMEGVFADQAYNAGRGNASGPAAAGGTSAAAQGYYDFLRQKNAAEKAGTTEGERVANAQLDLPGAVAQAQEQLRLVQELRNHPGRGQIGWHDVLGSAPLVPSTKGYDAQKVLDQIKGGAFLEAFKSLKGGGAITEVEGKKATDAIARMDRATSKAEFDKALSDYEGVIRLGIDRANQQAGKAPPHNFRGNSDWQQVKPGVRIRQIQ